MLVASSNLDRAHRTTQKQRVFTGNKTEATRKAFQLPSSSSRTHFTFVTARLRRGLAPTATCPAGRASPPCRHLSVHGRGGSMGLCIETSNHAREGVGSGCQSSDPVLDCGRPSAIVADPLPDLVFQAQWQTERPSHISRTTVLPTCQSIQRSHFDISPCARTCRTKKFLTGRGPQSGDRRDTECCP